MLAAGQERDAPEASEALEKLCGTYWYPLYAFVGVAVSDTHAFVTEGKAGLEIVERSRRARGTLLVSGEERAAATGIRNPVGLAIHPVTGPAW